MTSKPRRVSWRALRITTQLAAVLVFIVYLLNLVYPLHAPWPADAIFQLDPLVSLYLLLAGHGLPHLAWTIAALVLLFAVSRIFCGWICPLGAWLDFISAIRNRLMQFNRGAKRRQPPTPQHQRSLLPANFDIYLLVSLLVLALWRNPLVWLLDPIVYSFKFTTVILLPAVDGPLRAVYNSLDAKLYQQDWWLPISDAYQRVFTSYHAPVYTDTTLLLLFSLLIIGLELWQPRFWCRYVCPLGALNKLTFKLHPLRRRIGTACNHCLACEMRCHFGGTVEDDCLFCMNCIDACSRHQISFIPNRNVTARPAVAVSAVVSTEPQQALAAVPVVQRSYSERITGELAPQRISRRMLLEYALAGTVAYPFLHVLDQRGDLPADFIRPPGVLGAAENPNLAEKRFTELCIKCGQCLKACPTNGLQPALTEAGIAALWTPRLIARMGYCEFNCNLCGRVCPSSAIPRLPLSVKQSEVLGTAYFDRNRCIPFITAHNCTVCEEHCPTSDKAIKLREAAPPFWPADRPGGTIAGSGTTGNNSLDSMPAASSITTLQPYVDPALCIGCGICETVCPVPGIAAVRVLRMPPGSAYASTSDTPAGVDSPAGDYPAASGYPVQ